MTKKNSNKSKKGFTLIELIAVISIVLILSSVLIPKVIGYQDKARVAKVVNTANQIFNASMANFTEKEGKFVSSEDLGTAIKAVTDLSFDTGDITLNETKNAATVKFTSDDKNYNIKLDASANSFIVYDGAEKPNEIYKNK